MIQPNGVSISPVTEEKPGRTKSSLKRDATGSAKRTHEQSIGDSSPVITVPRKRPSFYVEIVSKNRPQTPLKEKSRSTTTGFEALKARVEASGGGHGARRAQEAREGKEASEAKVEKKAKLVKEEEERQMAVADDIDTDSESDQSEERQDVEEREKSRMVPQSIVRALDKQINTQSFGRMACESVTSLLPYFRPAGLRLNLFSRRS